ncbi:MAG: RimK/LysX family protein [Nostoc sp.]|uniref:ATP-dependent zinc protease family protein n=1 Tax=Nostoc sp. TaxID=1180 RepID=UPI002FFCB4BA
MSNYLIVGWREHVALPSLGIHQIKAKIDTGARTSVLYASDINIFSIESKQMIQFKIHPYQRDTKQTLTASSELVDERKVKNSGGEELRLAIKTLLELGSVSWEIELTLTDRELMGFRMLLGRQALKKHVLVDPGRSFLFSEVSLFDETEVSQFCCVLYPRLEKHT